MTDLRLVEKKPEFDVIESGTVKFHTLQEDAETIKQIQQKHKDGIFLEIYTTEGF